MGKLEDVGSLYDSRPYPAVGLLSALQPVRRDDLPLLNYLAGYAASYGTLARAVGCPKILVAGCGTFEPVAVALANPKAEVTALDLSARSLEKLKWQARMKGVAGRIRTVHSSIESFQGEGFDYVVATGVLHHLEDPAKGLARLVEASSPRAVFRIMVYSAWGRDLLYGAKELAALVGAREPASFRRMIASLPAGHPYRIYFHLYSDAANDTGLADGYLHPCDQPFTAASLRRLLENAGLHAGVFLHRPGGQPRDAEALADFSPAQGPWERLGLLDCLGQLEENFHLFAGRGSAAGEGAGGPAVWNPALPRRGAFFSKLLGRKVAFDQSEDPASLSASRLAELRGALFLLGGGP